MGAKQPCFTSFSVFFIDFHQVYIKLKQNSQAHSLELRGHLVIFQSGFTFTVNWLMRKSEKWIGSSTRTLV